MLTPHFLRYLYGDHPPKFFIQYREPVDRYLTSYLQISDNNAFTHDNPLSVRYLLTRVSERANIEQTMHLSCANDVAVQRKGLQVWIKGFISKLFSKRVLSSFLGLCVCSLFSHGKSSCVHVKIIIH